MMVDNKFLLDNLIKFKNGYKWYCVNEYESYTEVSIVNENGNDVCFHLGYDLIYSFVINVTSERNTLDEIKDINEKVSNVSEFFVRTKVEVEIDKGERKWLKI